MKRYIITDIEVIEVNDRNYRFTEALHSKKRWVLKNEPPQNVDVKEVLIEGVDFGYNDFNGNIIQFSCGIKSELRQFLGYCSNDYIQMTKDLEQLEIEVNQIKREKISSENLLSKSIEILENKIKKSSFTKRLKYLFTGKL